MTDWSTRLTELGIEGVEVTQWYGLFAPADTPAPIVDRLNAALNSVLADAQVVERFESHGASATPGTAGALARQVRSDLDRWKKVVANISTANT